jgi:ATP-dependent helicase HrpA
VHRGGLLRLFMLQFREQLKYLEKNLPGLNQMAMQFMALGTLDELRRQLIDLSCARACLASPGRATPPASAPAASKPSRDWLAGAGDLPPGRADSRDWQALQKKLPAFKPSRRPCRMSKEQLARLIQKRFIRDAVRAPAALSALSEGDRAAARQAEGRRCGGCARDARLLAELAPLADNYQRRAVVLARQGLVDAQLEQFRWLLEELRVQLFAQELRTPVPVSTQALAEDVGRACEWPTLKGVSNEEFRGDHHR